VNLTYQVFNLRMILERSLTDRIWNGQPRRQAVLGFNVSVDPPAYAAVSAAVIEITVEKPATASGDVALVAMMPQEKTYNATALNSKSNAFAGAAVVKVVNVGMAARKTQKVMYLYRDNDTLSFEHMPRSESNKGELEFGWVFRPVLGRRSVSPGMRQMFVVISLPENELPDDPDRAVSLNVKVRTYWKKFKPEHMTSYTKSQAFGKDVLKNLFWTSPELKGAYLNHTDYTNVLVRRAELDQNSLRPEVDFVDWTYTGARTVLVTLHGRNFFTGTSVVMGGKPYKDASNGLLIKSDSQIDLLTDVDSLIRSDGVVVGRYGNAAAIVGTRAPTSQTSAATPGYGFELRSASVGPTLGAYRQLTINADTPDCERLPHNPKSSSFRMPFVLLDDTLVSDKGNITCLAGKTKITLNVLDNLVSGKAPILRVVYPFYPMNSGGSMQIVNPDVAFELDRISSESDSFLLKAKTLEHFAIQSNESDGKQNCWELVVGPEARIVLPAGHCTYADPGAKRITNNSILISSLPNGAVFKDRFILLSPGGFPYELTVPPSKPDPKKPAFVKEPVPTINQFDARWIELLGDGLQAVASAKINGANAEIRVIAAKKPEDKDKLQVNVTRAISEKPGDVDITFYDGNTKVVDTVRIRVICTACKGGDK
jgi:hypothetical protein